MSQQMRVFVSHSHEDDAFCHAMVQGLRDAGADVWYDEDNLGTGEVLDEILTQLCQRPVFIVVLSKAAFASSWVRDECKWAFKLYKRQAVRIILPIVARPIEPSDFNGPMLFLEDFWRVDGFSCTPSAPAGVVQPMLRVLGLTSQAEKSMPPMLEPVENPDETTLRAKALIARGQYSAAIPLLKRVTQVVPESFDAMFSLGYVLNEAENWQAGLAAWTRALELRPDDKATWCNKGYALRALGSDEDALAAFEHALALDIKDNEVLNNIGITLWHLNRPREAFVVFRQALTIDELDNIALTGEMETLYDLGQDEDAQSLRWVVESMDLNLVTWQHWLSRKTFFDSRGVEDEPESSE